MMEPKEHFALVSKAYKKGRTDGVGFAVKNYSAVMLLCLKDKFGFDTEQLIKIKDCVNESFDAISENYLTLEDVARTLKEENEIDLHFSGKVVLDDK